MTDTATRVEQGQRYVGRRVRRIGDRRLVTGAGQYVDDVRLPGTLHAAFVRSPHAHATIRGVDASAALALPSVAAVYTGEDLPAMMQPQVAGAELLPGRELRRYPLARERARYYGDAVAVVLADDPYVARDAAALVEAAYEPATGELTAWASTQVPHTVRTTLANNLGLPEHAVRVIAPDVGGAFGAKGGVYPEYLLIPALARELGRPVKWQETRSESFLATNHGRDQRQRLRAAVRADGEILGREVEVTGNCGAYNAATVPLRTGLMATGPYRIRDLRVTVQGVMTNTTPTGAYRGAGRPEAAYMLERLLDAVARELGLDPAEVRRRNFVPPEAFPYEGATGVRYDSGDYGRALDEALRRIDYAGFRAEQAAARREGRLVGLGLAVYCEFAGPAWDSATVRAQPGGTVTVAVGASPHGQGTETAFAQLVADGLGVALEDVAVVSGDTARTPQGIGTFGSRNTSIGGSAVLLATRQVREKARRIAAQLLEAAEEDVELTDGHYGVRGMPERAVTFKQIARAAYAFGGAPGGLEPGLEATSYFTPDGRTFPFGAHVALVEIDPATGELAVRRYLAVDDCGPVINPAVVEGQVLGGLAQGFGQALQEAIVYDEGGQLLSGTFLDYAVPVAPQLPDFETAHTVTPSPFNPLGAKGVGEAGTTGAPPALVNAALDALAPLGVTHLDMPLTPERLWQAIRGSVGALER